MYYTNGTVHAERTLFCALYHWLPEPTGQGICRTACYVGNRFCWNAYYGTAVVGQWERLEESTNIHNHGSKPSHFYTAAGRKLITMENTDKLSDSAPKQNGHATAEEDEKEQTSRELTQTDRINRSLLNSFLQRLDDPNSASQFPKVERINTDGPDPQEERDDEKNDNSVANSTSEPNTDR